jgi:hypothetical protein
MVMTMTTMMIIMRMTTTITTVTIWKLNNAPMYPLDISAEEAVTKNFLHHLENIGLTKKHPKSGTKSSAVTNVPYSMPLT